MLAFVSIKHRITVHKDITDFNRRMGPPVNKIIIIIIISGLFQVIRYKQSSNKQSLSIK